MIRQTQWTAGAMGLALVLTAAGLGGCTVVSATRAQNQRELGVAAYNRGEYDLAQMHLRNAIEGAPTGAQQHYWMGRTLLAAGRPVAAQSSFEYALELVPLDPQWRPRILDGIAEAMFAQGLRDQLHSFLADCSTRYGTTADYLREASYLRKTGDPDGALVACRKAVRFAGDDSAEPYLAVADFYESINDVPNAVLMLRYAYWIEPQNRQIAERFRRFGIVPGPTLRLKPPDPDASGEPGIQTPGP